MPIHDRDTNFYKNETCHNDKICMLVFSYMWLIEEQGYGHPIKPQLIVNVNGELNTRSFSWVSLHVDLTSSLI